MSLPALLLRRAALAEVLPLRHAELRPGMPLAAATFPGDDDPATLHCGAFLAADGTAVGCVSLMPRARKGIKISVTVSCSSRSARAEWK